MAGDIFVGEKQASQRGAIAEQRKKIRGDANCADAFGVAVAGEIVVGAEGNGDIFEAGVAVLDVEILRGGKPILRDAEAGGAIPEDDELGGVFVGKRAQQKRAGDAEDGSVCADADGERQDGGDGEAGIFGECAECVAEVANQGVHREPEPFIADDSPGQFSETAGIRRRSRIFVSYGPEENVLQDLMLPEVRPVLNHCVR